MESTFKIIEYNYNSQRSETLKLSNMISMILHNLQWRLSNMISMILHNLQWRLSNIIFVNSSLNADYATKFFCNIQRGGLSNVMFLDT